MIGEGTSCLELGRMMEVRWHPIVATVDGIVVDLVWVVVDMRGHNVHLSLRMGERMMMDMRWDYLVLIVALLVFIRRQPRRRTSVYLIYRSLIGHLQSKEMPRVIARGLIIVLLLLLLHDLIEELASLFQAVPSLNTWLLYLLAQ
jgi:hypothetical protein